MKVGTIVEVLDRWAPPALQESYDNCGLLVGEPDQEVEGVLVCLDCTEAVVDEAIEQGLGLVVAHHPLIFGSLKQLTGQDHVQRTVMKALRNNIAIFAAHTDLDNVEHGVNQVIVQKLGLKDTRILAPKKGILRKLVTFVPADRAEEVRSALFRSGAGSIGDYDQCSFNVAGKGTFRPLEGTTPYVGEQGERHEEQEERIETVFPHYFEGPVMKALFEAHPYEEVAYDIYSLENRVANIGSGMIGELSTPMTQEAFLAHLKTSMECEVIKYTPIAHEVQRIAVCGGAGSFLLQDAMKADADVLVTSDLKYHQFFDAEGRIMIADIGHYESEQHTIGLFVNKLREKFPKFAVRSTTVNTNPVNYFH